GHVTTKCARIDGVKITYTRSRSEQRESKTSFELELMGKAAEEYTNDSACSTEPGLAPRVLEAVRGGLRNRTDYRELLRILANIRVRQHRVQLRTDPRTRLVRRKWGRTGCWASPLLRDANGHAKGFYSL